MRSDSGKRNMEVICRRENGGRRLKRVERRGEKEEGGRKREE